MSYKQAIGSEGWIQPFVTNQPTLNYSFDLLYHCPNIDTVPKTQLFLHIFPPLSANQTCDPESVLHIVSGRIQDLACNRSFVSIEVECPGKGCFEDNNFNDSLLVCRLNKTQYNSLKIRTETVSKSDLIWFFSD